MVTLQLADHWARRGLGKRLRQHQDVAGLGKDEPEALAYSLGGLEESFQIVLDQVLPMLLTGTDQQVETALAQLEEEARSIVHYFSGSRFLERALP